VAWDNAGAITAIGMKITEEKYPGESRPENYASANGPLVSIMGNTWVGMSIDPAGALTIAFNNPIFVKQHTYDYVGAWISSLTFSNGSFTDVKGAPAFLSAPIFTGANSLPLRWLANQSTGLKGLADSLKNLMTLINLFADCNTF